MNFFILFIVSIVELSCPIECHYTEVNQVYLAIAIDIDRLRRIRSTVPVGHDREVHQIDLTVGVYIPSFIAPFRHGTGSGLDDDASNVGGRADSDTRREGHQVGPSSILVFAIEGEGVSAGGKIRDAGIECAISPRPSGRNELGILKNRHQTPRIRAARKDGIPRTISGFPSTTATSTATSAGRRNSTRFSCKLFRCCRPVGFGQSSRLNFEPIRSRRGHFIQSQRPVYKASGIYIGSI